MSMFHTQSRIGSEHLDFLQSALNSPSQGMLGSQRSLYSKPLCDKMMYVTRNNVEEVRKKKNGKKVTLKEEEKDMDLFYRIKVMFLPSQNDKKKKSNAFKTLLILSLILGGGGMLLYILNKRGVFNKTTKKKKDDGEEEVAENDKVAVNENGGKKCVKGHYIAPVSNDYTQITKKAAHTSYAPKQAYGHKKKVTYKDAHIPSYAKTSSPQYSQHYGDEQVGYMPSSKKYHRPEHYNDDDDDAEMDMHSYSRYGESPNMEEKYHMD